METGAESPIEPCGLLHSGNPFCVQVRNIHTTTTGPHRDSGAQGQPSTSTDRQGMQNIRPSNIQWQISGTEIQPGIQVIPTVQPLRQNQIGRCTSISGDVDHESNFPTLNYVPTIEREVRCSRRSAKDRIDSAVDSYGTKQAEKPKSRSAGLSMEDFTIPFSHVDTLHLSSCHCPRADNRGRLKKAVTRLYDSVRGIRIPFASRGHGRNGASDSSRRTSSTEISASNITLTEADVDNLDSFPEDWRADCAEEHRREYYSPL